LLAANAWGVRSYIPILNSRSKGFRFAGWLLLLSLGIAALAITLERRPWGFLKAGTPWDVVPGVRSCNITYSRTGDFAPLVPITEGNHEQ
jgi:hypothetical protein